MKKLQRLILAVTIILAGLAAPRQTVNATITYTVNSTADEADLNPADTLCLSVSGACTLRAAIQQSNYNNTSEIINVPAGTYTLTISGSNEDASATGDLDIVYSTTIQGSGATTTVINGQGLDRVLHTLSSAVVTIQDVTITNGSAPTGDKGGGGIRNDGNLTLNRVIITANQTPFIDQNNDNGAGISNYSILTINSSRISDNFNSYNGGGIHNEQGALSVNQSTISNNSAKQSGGGILVKTGNTFFINTTISGNIAEAGAGGGLYNTGTTNINRVTFANNIAIQGHAIYKNGELTLINSIIFSAAGSSNCAGPISLTSSRNNIENGSTCLVGGNGNLLGQDPQLQPLTYFGDILKLHPILQGSPAIDGGNASPVLYTDALGNNYEDGDFDGIRESDMGAYEYIPLKIFLPLIRR